MNKTIFSKLISTLFNSTNISLDNQRISNHTLNSIKLSKKILKLVNYKKLNSATIELDNLIDEYLDYCNYTNKEYYKAGFIDCLNLILPALFKNSD